MPPLRRSLKKLPQIVEQEVARQAPAGRQVRLMFQDEARFGRINDPRHCWAPRGFRPEVGMQIVREYTYAFGAVSPHDGALDTLVLPVVTAAAMSIFLAKVARRHPEEFIVMVLDGAEDRLVEALLALERNQDMVTSTKALIGLLIVH